MANEYRVTWSGVEVLDTSSGFARVTWSGLEVLRTAATIPVRVTWTGIEVLCTYPGAKRGKRSSINPVIRDMFVPEEHQWWQSKRVGFSISSSYSIIQPILFIIT